ncbi:MFS general substrate transporter [Dacryopinax primogenitus]|uniref:MFS general substrate transporter n=1 Tax=Dacryopinax primogenitus (strain DJM 731) TaxID=1858805 RepID=M5FW08_DACPD|nr:MFS general substrate transporter [Dacryopinax primogenitus]EJT99824.1 MFS general substrate transporter [Dacryopinax primogenitus]
MPFGILEDRHLEHVPGTSLIIELDPLKEVGAEVGDTGVPLKRGTGRNSHVILIPQPSDDPNDPLNWPRWKKELLFWPMVFSTGLVGAIGPLLTPGFVQIANEFGVSVDNISSSLNGSCIVAIGIAMFPMATFGQKYGRRPVFLLAAVAEFATSIWAALSTSLTSLTAARVIQGAGMAPLEALVTATIGDVFFVHERGYRLAVWAFAINAGIAVAPIVNGALILHIGWQWCFWIIAILFGISLILMIATFPETSYKREVRPRMVLTEEPQSPVEDEKKDMPDPDSDSSNERLPTGVPTFVSDPTSSYPPRRTWIQDMRPFSGVYDPLPFWKTLLRPLPFFLSPVVIWGTLAYGFTTAWLVVLSVTESLIFSLPPYYFDSQSVGLVSIGALITGILAVFISGPICDWCATGMSKLNAKFRLLLVIPMIILEVMGYVVWGAVQAEGGPWIGPVILIALINFGQGLGITGIVTYVVDAHRGHIPEAFAVINFIKNMLAFGTTYFVNGWVETQGVFNTLATLSGLAAVCLVPTLPMYIFGKRVRSWIHRHPKLFLRE